MANNLNLLRALYRGEWPDHLPPSGGERAADISFTFHTIWSKRASFFIKKLQDLLNQIPFPGPMPGPRPMPEPVPLPDDMPDFIPDDPILPPSILRQTFDYSLYAGSEFATGAWTGFSGTPRFIWGLMCHPVDTVTGTARGMYTLFRHPVISAQAIYNEAYERPWRMAGNIPLTNEF